MRKKCLILIFLNILMLITNSLPLVNNNIFASSTYYARIEIENAFLYSSPFEDEESILFKLPKTYFVKIYGEENDRFYKAEYIDQNGYIKKTDVRFVKETPQTPYAENISFRVFAQNGLALRSSPYTNTGSLNLITHIPFLDSNLIYYGTRQGEESIVYKGDTWYYCKYINNDNIYTGYVYSAYCDLLSPIKDNTEELTFIDPPDFSIKVDETNKPTDKISQLETPKQIALIILVSLPCVLIAYFIFKPTLISAKTPTKHKKKKGKIKKLKKSDYFELDDSYF